MFSSQKLSHLKKHNDFAFYMMIPQPSKHMLHTNRLNCNEMLILRMEPKVDCHLSDGDQHLQILDIHRHQFLSSIKLTFSLQFMCQCVDTLKVYFNITV